MRICLVLEGSYPYVHGGVSTWMHQYITEMKEHEFIIWVIGANEEKKGMFVYEFFVQNLSGLLFSTSFKKEKFNEMTF